HDRTCNIPGQNKRPLRIFLDHNQQELPIQNICKVSIVEQNVFVSFASLHIIRISKDGRELLTILTHNWMFGYDVLPSFFCQFHRLREDIEPLRHASPFGTIIYHKHAAVTKKNELLFHSLAVDHFHSWSIREENEANF